MPEACDPSLVYGRSGPTADIRVVNGERTTKFSPQKGHCGHAPRHFGIRIETIEDVFRHSRRDAPLLVVLHSQAFVSRVSSTDMEFGPIHGILFRFSANVEHRLGRSSA